MGDNHHFPQRHAETQPHLRPFFQSNHHSELTNGVDGSAADEEEYTIRCICGYSHDDGNTVFCDECETWQHIDCYYYPDRSVPDIHQCVHCYPHPNVDASAASRRQWARLQEEPPAREPKKRPKSHKKTKTKDLQVNGFPSGLDNGPDRAGDSPRDHQQPPAKRAKTSHKPSNSVSGNPGTAPRPLSSSGLTNQPPAKRPLTELPPDYFSEDFINVHQNDTNFTTVNANLHGSIDFTNQLSRWLDDEDEFMNVTGGFTHGQVFQQAPSLEELEVPIQKRTHTDKSVVFHGSHPTWPYLTVEKDLVKGQLVAELRGLLGHRDEYKADPENRWDHLRHPDHFVFFHPYLPIYIDCRSEGTNLRYIRRSCRPNLEMKTFITDARDIRFCFNAMDDIPSGAEITIAWDIKHDHTLHECLQRHNLAQEKDYVSKWMETILSHFGGCACQLAPPFCFMEHWDRRLTHTAVIPEQNTQPNKSGKKRKPQPRKSPQNNGRASNSRAGSEANENDDDDEDDTRSSSRSSKASRDATPTTQSDSVREQRKLEQAMRRIEKQETEGQQGTRKKKRASGTSTKNSSKLGLTTTNSNTLASGKSRNQHKVNGENGYSNASPSTGSLSGPNSPGHQSRPRGPPNGIHREAVRSVYVDRSTQTDEEPQIPSPVSPATERKPYMSLSKRLLKRSYLRHVQHSKHEEDETTVKSQLSSAPPLINVEPASQVAALEQQQVNLQKGVIDPRDTEMKDAGTDGQDVEMTESTVPEPEDAGDAFQRAAERKDPSSLTTELVEQHGQSSHPPFKPPAPPWPPDVSEEVNKENRGHVKGAGLHIDMPPPSFPFSSANGGNSGSSPSTMSAPLLRSPSDSSSPLATTSSTPGGTIITQPSPVKKRMSLSDYIKKRNQTPGSEKSQSLSLQPDGDASMSEAAVSPTNLDSAAAVKEASPTAAQIKSEEA